MIDTSPLPVRRTWRFQKCCTTVWLVFSNTTRMRCWVLPGSVQLQDYYIRPEKMGAPRKDLADAILSYNGNDSQKSGEPFYRPLLQGCPDVPKYPELPFPHSPIGREALLHGHSSREYPPDGHFQCIMAEALSSTSEA
jgi:hypothetical protein